MCVCVCVCSPLCSWDFERIAFFDKLYALCRCAYIFLAVHLQNTIKLNFDEFSSIKIEEKNNFVNFYI